MVRGALASRGYQILKRDKLVGLDGYLDREEFKYVLWLDRIYQKIASVPGNIVEIGVAHGRNAILFGHLIKMNGDDAKRRYYGFDTFEGYSEQDLKTDPTLSGTAWKDNSLEAVRERISAVRLDDVCHFVAGDIRKTAGGFTTNRQANFRPDRLKVALLYIDCNAYDPAYFSMNFFSEFMIPGGVICIDEKVQGGETQALTQFCEERGLHVTTDTGPFAVPSYAVVGDNDAGNP